VRNHSLNSSLARQSGAALLFALVFLLILTIIGATAMQSSNLQERMSGNLRDSNLAFQAAEASLREAEKVLDGATLPAFGSTNAGYILALTNASKVATWEAYTWTDANSVQIATTMTGTKSRPRYVVEKVTAPAAGSNGSAVDFESIQKQALTETIYRITSKGTGSTGDANVILQSTFKRL
jgi:type IV pilus assembly protein PilX